MWSLEHATAWVLTPACPPPRPACPPPHPLQVIQLADYRAQLYDYLKSRMLAIAPNLTVLVRRPAARLQRHALTELPARTLACACPCLLLRCGLLAAVRRALQGAAIGERSGLPPALMPPASPPAARPPRARWASWWARA